MAFPLPGSVPHAVAVPAPDRGPGDKDRFAAESLERPALVRTDARTVVAGDRLTAVKDPAVRRYDGGWRAWVCCHPLDVAGEEDRMVTRYATSPDGLAWQWRTELIG